MDDDDDDFDDDDVDIQAQTLGHSVHLPISLCVSVPRHLQSQSTLYNHQSTQLLHFLFPPVTGLLMAVLPLHIFLFSLIMGSQNVPTLTSGVLNRIWPNTRNRKTCTVPEIPGRMGSPLNVSSCGDEYSG